MTIEKPIAFDPSLEEIERQLGKEIADDLRRSTDIPLSVRQKEFRERVNSQQQELLKKGNVSAAGATKVTLGVQSARTASAFCNVDGKSPNLPGLQEEIEKIPALLPSLLLQTSEDEEKCWLLEMAPANTWLVFKLDGAGNSLPVFSSRALADNFANRKQLAFHSVCVSAAELWTRVRECSDMGISSVAPNPCPECLHLKAATATAVSKIPSLTSLVRFLVASRALLQAKGNWALQSALQEADLKKRVERLCLAVMHFDPGHPGIHLELIRTNRILNNSVIILESARRIQQYSPGHLEDLADLIYQPLDQQSQEILDLQRNSVLGLVWAFSELTDDYDGATRFFSECLSRKPDDLVAHGCLGGALWYSGELDKAIDIYSRALLLSPADSNLLSSRGQILVEVGEYERALADLESSLQYTGAASLLKEEPKVPLRAYALNGRGAAYSGLAKFDLAQKDFDESIALCPKNAWVYYNMAVAHESKGDFDSAFRNYVISLKMREPKLNPPKRTSALARLAILKPDADGIDSR